MGNQQFWFWISLWPIILSSMPLGTPISQADEPTAMREMELTCIDDAVIHSATFQSNTQHLVSNRKGIFAAFVKSRNEDYTAQSWRLVRSTDDGRSFTVIAEGVAATNPPVLESDEFDNLFLCRVDWKNNNSFIDVFSSEDDFKTVRTLEFPGVSGGKFAMGLDRSRRNLCYMTLDGVLHRVTVDGQTQSPIKLLADGEQAVLQYSRDSFCRFKKHHETGGDEALKEISKKKPRAS